MKPLKKNNKPKNYRIIVDFSPQAMKEMRELQQLTGDEDIIKVIADSIKTYRFLRQEHAKGYSTVLLREGHKDRELVWG